MVPKQSSNFYRKAIKVLLWTALLLFIGLVTCIYLTIRYWPAPERKIDSKKRHSDILIPKQNSRWETLKSSNFFEFDEVPMNWRLNFSSQFQSSPGYVFKPVYGHGVYTFTDICIEDNPPGWDNATFDVVNELPNGTTVTRRVQLATKHLVGYNSIFNCNIRIKVNAGPNVRDSDKVWWITFLKKPVPADRVVVTNHTAFFVLPTCEGNLHHFWQDCTFGLYGAMKATSRLGSEVPNQLFYKQPLWDLDRSDGCHNPARYQEFLSTFSIRPDHDTFHNKPHGTCYQHAVFGSYRKGFWTGEPEGYVLKKMGADYSKCQHPYVIILQRSNRKILNADELLTAARSLGIERTFLLVFDQMTLREQALHVACADVLAGVQGAGLQWLRFMKFGGGLLEIAWPKLGWGYYYHELANYARLDYDAIETRDVFLNFTTYSNKVRHGKPISPKEQEELRGKPQKDSYDNHWKWADVKVDPEVFKQKLKGLILSVTKTRSMQ